MPTHLDHVRADFDRIARLAPPPWEIDDGYVGRLLERLPRPCPRTLEIGSGTGRITRRLAARCGEVVALDASAEMIRVAAEGSGAHPNVHYEHTDFDGFEACPGSFDAVVSVATLHHLPLSVSLRRMRDWVAPGGVLLVLDLGWPSGLSGWAQRALALPLSVALRLRHTGRLRPPADLRQAWDAHAAHDEYPAWRELRAVAEEVLPGHDLERHLFWRYSLCWRAPR
ncbi:MAG: class I SAM-dependent methyltransferase [Planctomycetota bacterium]